MRLFFNQILGRRFNTVSQAWSLIGRWLDLVNREQHQLEKWDPRTNRLVCRLLFNPVSYRKYWQRNSNRVPMYQVLYILEVRAFQEFGFDPFIARNH